MKRLDLVQKLRDALTQTLHQLYELGNEIHESSHLKRYLAVPSDLLVRESVGYCWARAIYYLPEGFLIVEVKEGETKARWGGFVASYLDLVQKIETPCQIAALIKVIEKLNNRLNGALESAWEDFTLDYKMVESVVEGGEK